VYKNDIRTPVTKSDDPVTLIVNCDFVDRNKGKMKEDSIMEEK
jgi:hypothetical protein